MFVKSGYILCTGREIPRLTDVSRAGNSHPAFKELFARAERFELPSTVLETAILPLNYARKEINKVALRTIS
jgi:hypothetical protein